MIVLAMASVFVGCSTENGASVESRENQLDASISKTADAHWTIEKELALDDHIISGAVNEKGKAALAVFKPDGKGNCRFSASTNRNTDEPIVSGCQINGTWYDLIWFGGTQTEYAEVTYLMNGTSETQKYDTSDMDIISIPNQKKEYTLQVSYFVREGNQYE